MFSYLFKYTQKIPFSILLLVWFCLLNVNLFLYPLNYTNVEFVTFPFINSILESNNYLGLILFSGLTLLQAVLVNSICNEHQILGGKKSNLTLAFFMLLLGFFNTSLALHPILFSNLFLLLSFKNYLNSYNNRSFIPIFNTAFYLGIASLFYFPSILFLITIFVIHFFYRKLNYKEWLATLIAFGLPWYLFFVVSYLFNYWQFFSNTFFDNALKVNFLALDSLKAKVIIIVILLCIVYSLYIMQKRYLRISSEEKDKLIFCVYFLLTSFFIAFSINNYIGATIFLVSILSILLSHAFYFTKKNKLAELFFTSVLIVVLFLQHFSNVFTVFNILN